MKYFLFIFFTFSLSNLSNGQEKTKNIDSLQIKERTPVYQGCETYTTTTELKKCMSEKLSELLHKDFNLYVALDAGIPKGKYRILALFKINKEGNIVNIRAKSDFEVLEQEAIRVLKLAPKMKPGIQNGELVIVNYALPLYITVPKKRVVKNKRPTF